MHHTEGLRRYAGLIEKPPGAKRESIPVDHPGTDTSGHPSFSVKRPDHVSSCETVKAIDCKNG
jgi:hypothetical protein